MVILAIVGDDYDPARAFDTGTPQIAKKAEKVAPLNWSSSRRNTKRPSRSETAPKYPTLLKGGALHFIGGPQSTDIFLCSRCRSALARTRLDMVCASGTPIGERYAGTAVRPG